MTRLHRQGRNIGGYQTQVIVRSAQFLYSRHGKQPGKKHGHGILRISNGTIYEGDWKDGCRHGHGVEVSTLFGVNTTYEGDWQNNKRWGLGSEATFFHGMKAVYHGGWKNNRKYGFGEENISIEDRNNKKDRFSIHSTKVNFKKERV